MSVKGCAQMSCMNVLKIHTADPAPKVAEGMCAMSMTCGLNFVSQLTSSSIQFMEHEGPLSIKCAFRGREIYEVEGARVAVDDSSYLIMNHGQRYASYVNSDRVVESFCLWYRPGFAEEAMRSLTSPDERLLDEPSPPGSLPVSFFERLTPHDQVVSPLLFRIHGAVQAGHVTSGWLEDQMHLVLDRLLHAHRHAYREAEAMPAARLATRLELYRRLHRAKDYLDTSTDTPISLAEAASVACLSPHHFLRTFKKVFGDTPHQYLGKRRMERARALVLTSEMPITQICYDLGFESLGSFSWLFRRNYGLSPRQLRDSASPRKIIGARTKKTGNLEDAGSILYD
jgi:AraC family transcriptional regulator